MIDAKLIEMLRCPAEGGRLQLADPELVAQVNQRIELGQARDALDQRIEQPIEGGLVNESGTRLYPIRDGIPTLVVDEAIALKLSGTAIAAGVSRQGIAGEKHKTGG